MIKDATLRDPNAPAPDDVGLGSNRVCAMTPYYCTPEPNAAVTLYSGLLEIEHDTEGKKGSEGDLTLMLTPRPAVRFRMNGVGLTGLHMLLGSGSGDAHLTLSDRSATVPVLVTGVANDLTGVLNGRGLIGQEQPIRNLFFHLMNFEDVWGSPVYVAADRSHVAARVQLEAEGWRVILDPVPGLKSLKAALRAGGGHAITHIGRVERSDGAVFSNTEADFLLDALYHFFSFCMGRWCAPTLVVHFNAAGDLIREDWTLRNTTSWRYVSSWHSGQRRDMMPSLFTGFMRRWQEPIWKDALRRSMWWYVSANLQAGGIDGGLILTQVALELIAWVLFVEDGHVVSAKGFDELPAADKLRLLVDRMRMSSDVPSPLKDLIAFETSKKVPYAPFKFVEIRNALVHPKNRACIDAAGSALVDAWELGLWYTELAILYVCGYSGPYVNRHFAQFAGQVEQVPWSPTPPPPSPC